MFDYINIPNYSIKKIEKNLSNLIIDGNVIIEEFKGQVEKVTPFYVFIRNGHFIGVFDLKLNKMIIDVEDKKWTICTRYKHDKELFSLQQTKTKKEALFKHGKQLIEPSFKQLYFLDTIIISILKTSFKIYDKNFKELDHIKGAYEVFVLTEFNKITYIKKKKDYWGHIEIIYDYDLTTFKSKNLNLIQLYPINQDYNLTLSLKDRNNAIIIDRYNNILTLPQL